MSTGEVILGITLGILIAEVIKALAVRIWRGFQNYQRQSEVRKMVRSAKNRSW